MRLALISAFATTASAADLKLQLAARPSIVYDSARDACDPIDVPDINPRAFRDAQGHVVMFALHYVNRPLRGPDLTHLKIDCRIALDSKSDANPAHYDDHAYIAATWTQDGTDVSALVHHEYHADQHKLCRDNNDGLGCWFNTILAYRSRDGGTSFARASPLVVASTPFTQSVQQGRHRGFFNPSNIFSDGRYRYVFTSTTGWDGQSAGSCLFRSSDPWDSGSWRAYDGSAFSVRFGDPYKGEMRLGPCQPVEPFLFPIGSIVRHVPSKLWIAVFQAPASGIFPVDGFYYTIASDLFHWSLPRLLLAGKTAYSDLCKVGPSIINYPSVLDPTSRSRNFDTVGDHPLLYFAVIDVEKCETTRRRLVYQPLDLTRVR